MDIFEADRVRPVVGEIESNEDRSEIESMALSLVYATDPSMELPDETLGLVEGQQDERRKLLTPGSVLVENLAA